MNTTGITDRAVADTPVAVVDFETTGLTPGFDRVVEVSVVRVEPGEEPRLVFDTLVNPMRRMAATEIHGISDGDVADAPQFSDIAGELVAALSDCVVAAYNVYFDLKFLNFELQNASVDHEPPHFCLMYMRPMLGLGCRCKLELACLLHGIEYDNAHIAANDALASARLLGHYLEEAASRDVHTYGDLANLRRYKFVDSFANDPFPEPAAFSLTSCDRLHSRVGQQQVQVHQVEGMVYEKAPAEGRFNCRYHVGPKCSADM